MVAACLQTMTVTSVTVVDSVSLCGAFLAPNMEKYSDKTSFLFKSEVYSTTQRSNFLHSHSVTSAATTYKVGVFKKT